MFLGHLKELFRDMGHSRDKQQLNECELVTARMHKVAINNMTKILELTRENAELHTQIETLKNNIVIKT